LTQNVQPDPNIDQKVPLYFVATPLVGKNIRPPVYNIKGRIYVAPYDETKGEFDFGKPVMVYERDVDELMFKSRINTESGPVLAWTRDAQLAAGVVAAMKKGDYQTVPVQLTISNAAGLLTPDQVKAQAASLYTPDELRAMLAAAEDKPEPAAKKKAVPVEDEPVFPPPKAPTVPAPPHVAKK